MSTRLIVTCAECLLKYEEDRDHDVGPRLRCHWCGSSSVGAGHSFDEACRRALQKISAADATAGWMRTTYQISEHAVHLGGANNDQIVHLVTLGRKDGT